MDDIFSTDSDCEEYIVNIDENGEVTKIPYDPFLECTGYYDRIEEEIEKQKEQVKYYNKIEEEQEKRLKNFKEKTIKKIIKKVPELIKVDEIKDAEIVLIIHNDCTQWDVREFNYNDEDLEFIEEVKELFDLSYYWFKRINKQKYINDILNYINKKLRK